MVSVLQPGGRYQSSSSSSGYACYNGGDGDGDTYAPRSRCCRRDKPEPPVAEPGQAHCGPRVAGAIYGWFTEGFDTADLQEAKALLVELET